VPRWERIAGQIAVPEEAPWCQQSSTKSKL
jgi:hypothetical protein